MKRILAAIIIFVLSTGLWGCGAQEKSQFDEATNQHETMQNISFQVPKEWEKNGDGVEEAYYLESEDSQFRNGCVVYFSPETGMEEIKSEIIEAYNQHEGNIEIETSDIVVSDTPAMEVKFSVEADGNNYINSTVLFEVGNGTMTFSSNAYTDMAYDDFWKVIDSIVI